jgi:putative flippase GtrA
MPNYYEFLPAENPMKSVVRHLLSRSFVRFLIVGGICTVLNVIGLYFLTDHLGLNYLISTAIIGLITNLIGFSFNKTLTFQSVEKDFKTVFGQFSKYNTIYVTGYFLVLVLMFIFVDIMGIWYVYAFFVTTFILTFFNYFSHKLITFKGV